MSESNNTKEHPGISIPGILIGSFSVITSIFFLFILFKSKAFQTYSFYFIIIFNIILILDNILRMFSFHDTNSNNYNALEKVQAFCLTLFKKLELSIMANQNLTYFLGVNLIDLYSSKKMLIFYISLFLSILISLIITIILFLKASLILIQAYCYVNTFDSDLTRSIDFIFICFFYFASIIFLAVIIRYLCVKKKEVKTGLIEDVGYNHHLKKIIILYIFNGLMYVLSFNEIDLRKDFYDLFYLIIVFFIDLAYWANRVLIKETLKLFCKNTYQEKYKKLMKFFCNDIEDEDNENEEEMIKRKDSFS